jgi:hypothetical protein
MGRWFYTCQKQQDDDSRCKFFLWDSDAKPREERALLNNSRSEPEAARTAPNTPAKPKHPSSAVPYNASRTEPNHKRSRALLDEGEDEFDLGDDDPTFDEELRQMADVETPRKAARTETFMTPRRKLPWDTLLEGIPTPGTTGRTSSKTRSPPAGADETPSRTKQSNDSSQTMSASSPTHTTPTPARFRDIGTPRPEDNLVEDVFTLLRNDKVHLNSKVSASLRSVLEKHARKAEGNSRSKEVLRLRIKAEEAKNLELSMRNNTLQAELEAAKATLDHMKWEMENDVTT